jgi:putative tryptophan/tyrosine transport system substrate-binding protein
MTSRIFSIATVLFAVIASGTPAVAQSGARIPWVALLSPTTPTGAKAYVEGFRQGMRELGYVEGTTFVLELRHADGRVERLGELARELVTLKPDVIVTSTDIGVAAVKRETRTIPIVMTFSSDPVGTGFVASLAHPGGNVTGLSNVSSELSGKRLELLREAMPGLARLAVLWNPDVRGAVFDYKETEAAARALRLELHSFETAVEADFDRALSGVVSRRAQALILLPGNAFMIAKRTELASFAQKNRLPTMAPAREYVDAGALMSYGPSIAGMYRRSATYVDKLLKGAKPGDLPVEQPSKFELVINLKTAKAIGLSIPPSIARRADQMIQ